MSQSVQNGINKLKQELAALRDEVAVMREHMKGFALKRGPQKQERANAPH